ncbi:MAG: hypothetical protein ACTSYD_07210 [Candidatus Heimdallarchaeaceae archaeon]
MANRNLWYKKLALMFVVFSAIWLVGSTNTSTVLVNGNEMGKEQCNSRFQIPMQTDENETTVLQRPLIAIEKTVNATLIEPEQWIHVEIKMTNIGNGTAYNLTIIDPTFPNISFVGYNWTEERFVQIDYNATLYYHYYFQAVAEGNYTLEATEAYYYDVNGTEYHSYSQRFNILVIEYEKIPILESDLWWKMFYYILAVTLGLIAVVTVDYFVFVRPKQPPKKKAILVGKTERTKTKGKKKAKKKAKKKKKKK